jgi:hypothetical protein
MIFGLIVSDSAAKGWSRANAKSDGPADPAKIAGFRFGEPSLRGAQSGAGYVAALPACAAQGHADKASLLGYPDADKWIVGLSTPAPLLTAVGSY